MSPSIWSARAFSSDVKKEETPEIIFRYTHYTDLRFEERDLEDHFIDLDLKKYLFN